jgi:hypothetical protein
VVFLFGFYCYLNRLIFVIKLKELIQNLSNLSGFELNEYISVNQVADTIISMIANNASIPKWSIEYKYEILFSKDFYFRFFYGDKEIARLISGKPNKTHNT